MPAPTVTAVTPNFGSRSGGTALTLTGTNFTGSTGVTIGGVAATALVVVSATSITITSPAGAAGSASIVVTNASGSNGANTLFFYPSDTGTPADIYVYLKGGRGDGYVPLWTGAYTDTLVDEKSAAYRDIFPSTSSLYIGSPVAQISTSTALTYVGPVVDPSGEVTGTTYTASTSDEIAHVEPRDFDKTFTWRSYASSTGLWYHFRLADILGVGSRSRDF